MLLALTCASLVGVGDATANPTWSEKQEVQRDTPPAACFGPRATSTPPSPGINPSLLRSTSTKKRSAACFITVDTLRQAKHALLVDVRDSAAFAQFRIPGSLNVPLHNVKTKSFLKTSALVLLDEGQSPSELQAACLELKKAGFGEVSVLTGGLKAWRDQGGALAGVVLQQDQLNLISAAHVFREGAYDDWLILAIGAVKQSELRKLLPHAETLRSAGAREGLKARIAAVAAKRKIPTSRLNVVIVDEAGSGHEKISLLVERQHLKNVFFLEQGLQGYRQFLTNQTAAWNRLDNPPRAQACRG